MPLRFDYYAIKESGYKSIMTKSLYKDGEFIKGGILNFVYFEIIQN